MTHLTKTLAGLTLAGLATAAIAVTPEKGAVLGTDAIAISTALAEDGYELTHYSRAAALIKVTAVKENQKHMILVSPRDGSVISLKSGAMASANSSDDTHRTNTAQGVPADLAEKLAAQGYELRRVKNEGYELEAYALRDGRMWELKLDPATGTILRVEAED
jgi:hypothetical protein